MMSIISYLRGKKAVVSIAVVIFAAIAIFYFIPDDDSGIYDTEDVSYGELSRVVDVTGKVKPAQSVRLAFEGTGKISAVLSDIGDRVFAGQELMRIESGDAYASMLQAQADLDAEIIALKDIKLGARDEDIAILDAKLLSAQNTLIEAQSNLRDVIQDSFTRSDNVIRNNVDKLFSNPQSTSPTLNISADSQLTNDIERGRLSMERLLLLWEDKILGLYDDGNLEEEATLARDKLLLVRSFLDQVALAVNSLKKTDAMPQATIDGYRSDVVTARTSIHTAIINMGAAEEKFDLAQSSFVIAERELDLKNAPPTEEEIASQEARIASKRAILDIRKVALGKTVLRAPFDGVVTDRDAEIGEIVSAGTYVVSLISDAKFEIETHIPEADIAGLATGNMATFTLDAYDEEAVFNATVAKIDPAETVIDGVPTYKTILTIDEPDARIKSGMTADLSILVERRENIITIPSRAISTRDGARFVRVIEDGSPYERKVSIGLRGSNGRIEILSGIGVGDTVIVFENK